MNKIYTLKPWDEVENHHFISRERWDILANAPALEVKFLDGFLITTAMIYPKGETPSLSNVFMVCKEDLRECVRKAPTNETPNREEKTYTKDDIRRAGARAMAEVENEEDAIASALAISKLINKLN